MNRGILKKALFILAVFVFILAGSVAVYAETYGDFAYYDAGEGVRIARYNGPGGDVVIPEEINGKKVIKLYRSEDYGAFEDCENVTSVKIPKYVTSIGSYTFSGCRSLKSIEIPSGVKYIYDRAFSDCTGLTSIDIPSSVTSIGDCAFSHCSGLTSITVDPENPNYDSSANCADERPLLRSLTIAQRSSTVVRRSRTA